mgnify:CR=1 FL=1
MANLVQDLGSSYFDQSMSGSVFLRNGVPHLLSGMSRSGEFEVFPMESGEEPRSAYWGSPTRVSSELFESFSVFAAPPLGYRNYVDVLGSNVLVHLSRVRSTRRGFRTDTTAVQVISPKNGRVGTPQQAALIACAYDTSSFKPYHQALTELREGAMLGAALSADLALITDYSRPGGCMSILFRGQKVADVDEYGDISRASKAFRTTKHYLRLVKKGEAL